MTTAYVPEPTLEMTDGTPVSAAFGDVYFSKHGGVAETSHVFLAGNGLPERWAKCECFSIAELGFGTSLNFLVTLQRFRETAPADAVLHYHAVEKFPFAKDVLKKILALQPELAKEAAELIGAYPLRLPGPHRIHLPRCVLTLWWGEVGEWLPSLHAIDAWYLDGFAPAKNPDMWSPEIFTRMASISAPRAAFATFTAASAVRRGLAAAGFTVEKVPGFGKKREMLKGVMGRASLVVSAHDSRLMTHDCIILGAGIAGATLARALAERGHRVTVLERGAVASGASGNAAGVLFPPLQKRWNSASAFYFAAYDFMLRSMARWSAQGLSFAHSSPGMLRLPRHTEEEAQLTTLNETLGLETSIVHWLARDAASEQAGVALPTGAAFFPQGSWLSPRELCAALLQHSNILLREHCAVESIVRAGHGWAITLATGEILQAQNLVTACADASAQLLADYCLRLDQVGGQISEIAAADVAARLRSILCRKGYVIPRGEHYLIGATYHRDALTDVTAPRHAENLAELQALLPDWYRGEALSGRSSIRATTPDRLPYIGALDAGLYISTGHGSRGLLSAPLAAEIIASELCGEASPVMPDIARAVNPLRFKK